MQVPKHCCLFHLCTLFFSTLAWQEAPVWPPWINWVSSQSPGECQHWSVYSKCLTTHPSLAFLNPFVFLFPVWPVPAILFTSSKGWMKQCLFTRFPMEPCFWGVSERQIVSVFSSLCPGPWSSQLGCVHDLGRVPASRWPPSPPSPLYSVSSSFQPLLHPTLLFQSQSLFLLVF